MSWILFAGSVVVGLLAFAVYRALSGYEEDVGPHDYEE